MKGNDITMKRKQLTYSELVRRVEENKNIRTKWDVVCMLIGYQKVITEADWENIMRMYSDDIID